MEQVQENNGLGENANKLPFQLEVNLLWYQRSSHELPRLVIPAPLLKEIFAHAHDDQGHQGIARSQGSISRTFYVFGLRHHLKTYIQHCHECQTRRTPRHRPYGSMQPILTPTKPFHTISIDFVLSLLETTSPYRFDSALTVTDKFFKAVIIIPG